MDTAPPASSELVVDDLSAVAGLLVDNLKDESNEKFKNSAFLGFMRQVRDKELVVDGNEFVPSSSMSAVDSQQQSSIPSSLKGKGVLRDPSSSTDQPVLLERRKSVHFESGGSFMDDWDTQQGEEVQREASSSSRQATGPNYFALQEAEWANLQQDWDAWDATVNGYQRMGLPDSDSQFAEGERARRMYTEHQAAHRVSPPLKVAQSFRSGKRPSDLPECAGEGGCGSTRSSRCSSVAGPRRQTARERTGTQSN